MGKGSFWVIDGIKVKKNKPFVFQIRNHNEDQRREIFRQGNIFNTNNQADQMGRNFFAENIQDIQGNKFDYGMLKNNSVSSLKDFHLFGPPPVFSFNGQHINYIQNENNFQEVKKSIYINQFIPFNYQQKKSQ